MILASQIAKSQEFEYGKTGLTPGYLVFEIPGRTQGEIFTTALNWIKETYRNPDVVIKTTIDTQMIRFEGFGEKAIRGKGGVGNTLLYDASYTVELEFKPGRFRVVPVDLKVTTVVMGYVLTSEVLRDGGSQYTKTGKPRPGEDTFTADVEGIFNSIHAGIMAYSGAKREW